MKEYFKYANGYVNINDENLYLTNSGNWSEIQKLEEKSKKSKNRNTFKLFKIDVYYFVIGILILVFIINLISNLQKGKVSFISIGLLFLMFTAFKYMKSETGKKYKIPLSKIKDFIITDNTVTIHFLNLNNEIDFETISKVEDKGLNLIKTHFPTNNS
jgi:hypothetical protein